MNELKIEVKQQLGVISTNFEDIKTNLVNQMEIYKELEVTESNKTERKKDIATLRKISKAVSDKRIEVKKECLKPYVEFEEKANQLIQIINEPINIIDNQVKEFEEKQRLEKKEEINKIYNELIGELEENVPLSSIYDDKWENVATSIKSIRSDMSNKIETIQKDVMVIKGMVSDKTQDALDNYWNDLDLSRAISTINSYEEYKRKIIAQQEEKQRIEKEREAEQQRLNKERELERERERVREEERAKIRREEQIKEDARLQAMAEQTAKIKSEQEAMAIQKLSNISNMVSMTYKILATPEELEQIEMYLQSIGVEFERIDLNA
jgi:hypothetical protein